jgi:hypothetical protein
LQQLLDPSTISTNDNSGDDDASSSTSSRSSSSSSRSSSVFRGEIDARSELRSKLDHYDKFHLDQSSEMVLAKHLIKFKDVLIELSEDLYPSKVRT